jgi:methylsterol monooxygenase/4-alpha-methyl-delta7-sterol-4alpha-methyl oxidase
MKLEEVPGPLNFVLSIMFCMMCEDFAFYWSHRMLHTPFFYKHVHKIHHQHIINVSIAAINAHPFEFIFGNLVPLFVGPLLLGDKLHMLSWWGYIQYSLFETLEAHSGYEFPWTPLYFIPFSTGLNYHAYHHSANTGNYAIFFSIWDTVFDTMPGYNQQLEDREQIEILDGTTGSDSKVK